MFDAEILVHALQITALVFIMMVIVDWLDVRTRGKIKEWMTGKKLREYLISAFLGATPGCLGAFMDVSLYMHGFLSFGAMVGAMIATSGDESFVMFAEFPLIALGLHLLLFVLGVSLGFLTDYVARFMKIEPCVECEAQVYHAGEDSIRHYLSEHVWKHIIQKHLLRIFLWTLFALWFVYLGERYLDLHSLVKANLHLVIILAALIGLVPESGPHLIFIMMFSQGIIPFSVLLTSSIVQDGHGLLPLLSYSVRDTLLIKMFKVAYGLMIGAGLLVLGF